MSLTVSRNLKNLIFLTFYATDMGPNLYTTYSNNLLIC